MKKKNSRVAASGKKMRIIRDGSKFPSWAWETWVEPDKLSFGEMAVGKLTT